MKFGTAAFALSSLAAGVVAAPVAQNNPQGYTPQNAQWNAAAQPQNFNPAQNAAPAPAPYPQQGNGNGGLGLPLIGNIASPLSGLGGGNGGGIGGIGLGGGNGGGIGGLGNPLDMVKGLGGGLLPLQKRQGGSASAGANADANSWTHADGYGGVGANGFANADAHAQGQGHGGNNVQIAGLPFVGNIANAPSAVLDVAQDAVGQAAGSVMGLANGLMGGNARAGGNPGQGAPGNY